VNYWLRILVVNTVAALAIVGISGGFTPGMPWHRLLRAIGIALVYANVIGTLLAVVVPLVARRYCGGGSIVSWAIVIVTIVIGSSIGTVIATGVLSAIGVIERQLFWPWLASALSTSLFISLVIGTAVTAYETLKDRLAEATVALRTKERDEAEARRVAAEAHLTALENRVQPHFLFNTLNSIAALTHEDPKRAEKMTTELASLLRSSLDSHRTPLVPLADELHVVRNYLEIERVRFGDRLRYTIDADEGALSARVPRLAVQTLVENSVKYAISPRRGGGSIGVRAHASNGHLRVEVNDDGPGFDAAAAAEGHGLALLRARLEMLFGDRATLEIVRQPTSVSICVPTSSTTSDSRSNG